MATINRSVGILSIHTIHYTGSNKPTCIDDDDDDANDDYDGDDYDNVYEAGDYNEDIDGNDDNEDEKDYE